MTELTNLLTDYTGRLEALNFSPTTTRTRFYNVRAFLRWLLDTYAVRAPEELTTGQLRSWQTHLAETVTGRGLPLKPRSINKNIESVRAFLADLVQAGRVHPSLPAALEYVRTPKPLPRAIPHSRIRKLLRSIDTTEPAGYRNRTMFELAYSSGLRASELTGLDVPDIDFDHATALVRGKGNKERLVPIGKTALRWVESYTRAVRPFLLREDRAQTALFLDDAGKRMPYHTLRRITLRSAAAAGLDGQLTTHVFRRSCTSELVKGNANLYHIKEFLGHESLDTLQHYARLNIDDLRKTHDKTHPREKDTH